jgi:hypothetical protein
MKTFTILIFIVTALLSISTFAADTKLTEDEAIYLETKMLCQASGFDILVTRGSVFMDAFSSSGAISTIQDLYRDGSFKQLKINHNLETLTLSPGYYQAIHECFGNDEQEEKLFFIGLLITDMSAKMSSWAFDLTSIRALTYAARTIYAASYAEMPQRLMWGWIVLNLALKNRTILTKIGDPALLSTMLASLLAKNSFTDKLKQKITLSEMEKNDPVVQKIISENNDYEKMLIGASAQKQKVLMMFIEMNNESIRKLRTTYRPS